MSQSEIGEFGFVLIGMFPGVCFGWLCAKIAYEQLERDQDQLLIQTRETLRKAEAVVAEAQKQTRRYKELQALLHQQLDDLKDP